jgi:uroporphyrinogen decarboxylase
LQDPALAAETAMGPVHDFNFDAAILFSDLLFPAGSHGHGLRYDGPQADFHLRSPADVARLQGGAALPKGCSSGRRRN